ncbi:aspartate/glutamate racemase family protein [Bacillus pseudomycoides]|uniref:aspartate/glutamate racemase family protein n=1 Tax=Bacillus pseudomycoides TaxID=64104 RepID=UPI000BFCD71E|nr:aspartate/glutamate racemase family protein [Bacillus pseudomycoides]MED1625114.1 aspartate/glutamate racemase family protein [Bacillus pseudomycoides]PHC41190.1 aspartate racemase [Bacillus pseudomycoides]
MEKIGLIGGLSYESTIIYYEHINKLVNKQLGEGHSAKLILYSMDSGEVQEAFESDKIELGKELLIEAAKTVEKAGASCLLMCCNSVHKVAEDVQKAVNIPLIHICDSVVETIDSLKLKKIGLLGTNFTMHDSFYKKRLTEKGVEVLLPDEDDRNYMHQVIFNELVVGKFLPESKENFKRIIDYMIEKGAEGVILGCTEIPLLINQDDVSIPVFNTACLHAEKAVNFVLERSKQTI